MFPGTTSIQAITAAPDAFTANAGSTGFSLIGEILEGRVQVRPPAGPVAAITKKDCPERFPLCSVEARV